MSRLSAHLAKEIGLNEKECQLILQVSPMHDVGKIDIPDSILLKPGKLDDKE
jgi:putative two-component system response regulator